MNSYPLISELVVYYWEEGERRSSSLDDFLHKWSGVILLAKTKQTSRRSQIGLGVFFELPAEASVSISDTEGNLVNVCQYQSPEVISIPIMEGEGIFRIEIKYDSNIFIGEFESI